MPTYSFECETCKIEVDLILSMAERDEPQLCSNCGYIMKRKVTMPNIHGLDSKIGRGAWGKPPPKDDKKADGTF